MSVVYPSLKIILSKGFVHCVKNLKYSTLLQYKPLNLRWHNTSTVTCKLKLVKISDYHSKSVSCKVLKNMFCVLGRLRQNGV